MKKVVSSLAVLGCLHVFSLSCQSQPLQISSGVQTLPSLQNKTVNLSGRAELHISGKDAPSNGQVNLTSPDAWLFLDNVRPSVVLSDVLPRVRVNGVAAVNGVNVRVAQYVEGTVIIPQSADFSPMQLWNKPAFGGKTLSLSSNTFWDNTNLGRFNKAVGSFKLKRGFMATIAENPDGTGKSRIYIAQDGDLSVSALPAQFQNAVQYVRVLPWQWIGKRGWCGGDPEYQVNPLWWYNWGNTSTSLPNIEFVPMKWDEQGNTLNINNKQGSTHLLAFNEPNGKDQADMTPDEAVAKWPELQQSGLRLGSPAPTDGGAGWLAEFIDKADAKGLRVDYVAVHFYRCGQSAGQFYNYLKSIHERTGRPIWITEYNNGANWTSCPDPTFEQNAKTIGEWSDMMERTPWIERYSLYNWVEDPRAAVLNGQLTPMGKVYRDKPSHLAYQQELPSGFDADARYTFTSDAGDSTGSGNDGMMIGAPTFVAGKSGARALQLDGERSYVQLPASVGSGAGFSFAAWVNWKGGANFQRIFDLGDGEARYLFLSPNADGKLRFAITTGGNTAEQRLESAAMSPNQWTHVAVTIQNGVGKLFINGALAATNPNMNVSPDKVKTKFNFLGKSQFGSDPLFAGQLQDVSFAGTALSDAQIKGLMAMSPQLPPFLSPVQPDPIRGMVGVGTWGTQAEFKNIKVAQNGKTLYASDFSKGIGDLKTTGGQWEVADGVLRQTSGGSNVRTLFGDPTWSNYTLTLQARKVSGGEGFLIFFGSPTDEARNWINLGGWGNTLHGIQGSDIESPRVPGTIETGRWYNVRVEVQGPSVKVFLDDKLVQSATQ